MLVEVVRIQRQVAVVEVLPVVEAQRQVALAESEFGQVVAEQQAAVVEYLSMAELAARVEPAALVVRVATLLVLQGPQMSEAVQAHQKAALADQAE